MFFPVADRVGTVWLVGYQLLWALTALKSCSFVLFFYYYLGVLKIPLTQLNMGILKKLAEAKGLKLLIASHKLAG